VRINGDDNYGIWIPSDMEDYEQIVTIIKGDLKSNNSQPVENVKPSTDISPSADVIVNEASPESFPSFIKLIQDNLVSISLFTTLAILISYFKLYFYFGLYGLNINSFIDVSEIILAFSPIIKELLVLAIFHTSVYRLFEFVKTKKGRPIKNMQKYSLVFQIILVISGWVIFYRSIPGFLKTKIIIETNSFTIDIIYVQLVILAFAFGGTIMLVYIIYIHVMVIIDSDRLVTMSSIGIALIFSFLLIIMLESKTSYSLNEAGYPRYSVKILLSSQEQLESSDSLVYIGGTINYHFFHDFKHKRNTIVPKSSVVKESQTQLRVGL
jgi:hypothetical protein